MWNIPGTPNCGYLTLMVLNSDWLKVEDVFSRLLSLEIGLFFDYYIYPNTSLVVWGGTLYSEKLNTFYQRT
jgi:hypothetical protein